MAGPLHVLSARLQSDTPVSSVQLEPYVLCRRADGTTVSAGGAALGALCQPIAVIRCGLRNSRCPPALCAEEVPAEGHTDSRFSVKCRWYRSVVTKGGQVRHPPALRTSAAHRRTLPRMHAIADRWPGLAQLEAPLSISQPVSS
mgnify:CR=1 FL=1